MNLSRQKLLQLLFIGGVLGVASPVLAVGAEKATKDEAGLRAADLARYKAMTEKNVEAVRLALADELAYVHSSGTRQSKAEHLYDLEHRANYQKIEVTEIEAKVYGNVGVINGLMDFVSGPDPNAAPAVLRYLDVYVWRDGRWQMVSFHCTRPNQQTGGRGGPPGAGFPGGAGPARGAGASSAPTGQ